MIMAGYEYRGKMPFKHVYFTGIVRDKLGRKMSKSLGNSPDPIKLIDKYGADGVRMGMMLSAPAGNDILFDESLCEQGRNFNNKIWNAFRLIKGLQVVDEPQTALEEKACRWMEAKLRSAGAEMDDHFSKYRISDALMTVYRLFWEDFSAWFLEMVKPAYGKPIDRTTFDSTLKYFETLLKMLHPFMPFITEELWHHLYKRNDGDSIMHERNEIEKPKSEDESLLHDFENVKLIIGGVRTIRNQKNISLHDQLNLVALKENKYSRYDDIVIKMANLKAIDVADDKAVDSASFLVGTDEYAVPVGSLIDIEAEKAKQEVQLQHLQSFLASIEKKLSNQNFVAHAPEAVVEMERKKKSDTEEKIETLKESLSRMG